MKYKNVCSEYNSHLNKHGLDNRGGGGSHCLRAFSAKSGAQSTLYWTWKPLVGPGHSGSLVEGKLRVGQGHTFKNNYNSSGEIC